MAGAAVTPGGFEGIVSPCQINPANRETVPIAVRQQFTADLQFSSGFTVKADVSLIPR